MLSRHACRPAAAALLVVSILAPSRHPIWSSDRPSHGTPQFEGKRLDPGVLALPDIFGPGKVLNVGRVFMKVTNFGVIGNPYTNVSADPSAQWPGASGVEYLNAIVLAVGAVDPTADPAHRRRVSYSSEWRPPSLDPEDRIYSAYEGVANGQRFVNDDGDINPATLEPLVDEDPLDGRDNDGDGLIDEDHDARGWQEFSCVMRDDTQEATNADSTHMPLGLECRQLAWTYGFTGFQDFNVVEYTIVNRSGHALDSLFIGWRADMDAGPVSSANYYVDDRDLPGFPSGEFTIRVGADYGDLPDPARRQFPHHPIIFDVSSDSALCPRVQLRLNGFAVADGDGDGGATPGVAAFLLVQHTVDPLGQEAPTRVSFRSFRSFPAGMPFAMGGNPVNDAERYAFMSATENIDPISGLITAAGGSTPADYLQWCSIGPFRNVPDGGRIQATIAFTVQNGSYAVASEYPADYQDFLNGSMSSGALVAKHSLVKMARDVQFAYEGRHEFRLGLPVPDFHGRETAIRLPPGSFPTFVLEDCPNRDPRYVIVTDLEDSWFDFDCDYCTGVWDYPTQQGLFHHTWNAAPPPVSVEEVSGAAQLAPAPNPAREQSSVSLALSSATDVEVRIFDLSGRLVRTVVAQRLRPGAHRVDWDLRDDGGDRVHPGLYFWRVKFGGETRTARLAVLE